MVRIRRFGIVHTANLVAALYAVIALVFFGIVALFALLGIAVGSGTTSSPAATFGAGVVGILIFGVIVVVFYAIVGWIFTAIACAIYNVVAGWVGGIEVELQSSAGPGGGYPAYAPQGQVPAGYGYGAPGAYPAAQGGGTPAPWTGGGPPPAPGR